MADKTPLRAADYVIQPIVGVPGAIALATKLLANKPKGAGDGVKAAAKDLKAVAGKLEKAWNKRHPAEVDADSAVADPRLVDRRVDLVWGSLHRRLSALAELPAAVSPRSPRALALLATLFGATDPLHFLTVKFTDEWAEVKRLVARVDEKNLVADIEELAGPEYFPEILASFEAYGVALKVTAAGEATEGVDPLGPMLRATLHAVTDYAVAVLAARSKKDKKADQTARAALAPILEARGERAKPKKGDDSPAAPPVAG